jgi:ABC-type branched-subunit amino acid transport system ATPase component
MKPLASDAEAPELSVTGVSKSYGQLAVLKGVTAKVFAGQMTAFIGPNGAGKTSLFHVISGIINPDEGRVRLGDTDITGWPPWRVARRGLGRQYQEIRVFHSLSALQNVLLGLFDPRETNPVWLAANFWRMRRREVERQKTAMEWLDFVGLADKAELVAGELSHGEQKLLSLARLLARKCPLLLLDEPTSALAPPMVEVMIGLLRRLTGELGVTVALIEHDMRVVSEVADWVYFMHEGRIAAVGRCDHVLEDPSVRELYIGL